MVSPDDSNVSNDVIMVDVDDYEEEPPNPPTTLTVLSMLDQVRLYIERNGGDVTLRERNLK